MSETELPLIQQAQALAGGIGSIAYKKLTRGPKQKPQYAWIVASDRNVMKVVELCESCELRSRKALELPHVRRAIELRRSDNPTAGSGPGRYRPWTIARVQACVDAIRSIRETGLAFPVDDQVEPQPTFWKEQIG